MHEVINEKVNVITMNYIDRKILMPFKIQWRGRFFYIKQYGSHHTIKEGKSLTQIFSVTDGNMAFRLRFNTQKGSWFLEEVSDICLN